MPSTRHLKALARSIRTLETQLLRLKSAYEKAAPGEFKELAKEKDRKHREDEIARKAANQREEAKDKKILELTAQHCPQGYEYHDMSEASYHGPESCLALAQEKAGDRFEFIAVPGHYSSYYHSDNVEFDPTHGAMVFRKARKNTKGWKKCPACKGHGWVKSDV